MRIVEIDFLLNYNYEVRCELDYLALNASVKRQQRRLAS